MSDAENELSREQQKVMTLLTGEKRQNIIDKSVEDTARIAGEIKTSPVVFLKKSFLYKTWYLNKWYDKTMFVLGFISFILVTIWSWIKIYYIIRPPLFP